MICNYSRPENFDDMMELNLSISEKLIRKNKFKSGYIVLSLFKNIIEFNEGTKNSHLYYEEDVNFDKKTQLLKMGKVIFEFVNFVNYLKKENKKAKITKEERERYDIFLEKIKNEFDVNYDMISKEDNLIRAIYQVTANNFHYAFIEILKTCKEYCFTKEELLEAYYEIFKDFAKRIKREEI